MKKGILLLGHGSRRPAANAGLEALGGIVQESLGLPTLPVFFQFGRPTLAEGVARFASQGIHEIIIVPVFLFPGVHLEKDVPEAVAGLAARYGEGLKLVLTSGLGPDPRLAEIVVERVRAAGALLPGGDGTKAPVGAQDLNDPGAIAARSRDLIEEYLGMEFFQRKFPGLAGEVVRRVVHATGNPQVASLLRFHPGAVEAGIAALRRGALIFADVRMVKAGINGRALRELGGRVICPIHHPRVHSFAEERGITRAAAAVYLFREQLRDCVAVVGNAPTALAEVIRQTGQGFRPALIIGTPVGFVGAAEVKARLQSQQVPYLTLIGSQGGSAVAAAAVNALISLAQGRAGL
ncbi:MAG: precorrin isomerase [Pelotomaculum sp.]|uniref:Precorrin isomerase n=1 Tax=Pelotomaculum thermopropionicum (strain DSM 13744 / JCM 10971 / SI) TaxID=370438 RepID=A5D3N3_PELTS|nr:precorrin isomerase [Pelotomaculum sp.]BAF59138.1 precorrin isomerase [Pelotomaculum thermopropionicum SI]